MPDITATLQLGNFPLNYCWPGPTQYATDLINLLTVTIPGSAAFTVSADAPADPVATPIWFRLVDGYLEGIYYYNGGWYRPHPVAAGSAFRWLYVGSEASVKTLDGGVDEAITDTTGPFWQIDRDFGAPTDGDGAHLARVPMGAGTFTAYDGVTRARLQTIGDGVPYTAGSEKVQLPADAVAQHEHLMFFTDGAGAPDATGSTITGQNHAWKWTAGPVGNPLQYNIQGTVNDPNVGLTGLNDTGGAAAKYHENLPPVIGCYFLKRTQRKYIKAV